MESYQTLLALAQQETGLHDYGTDTFREGLERLVNALNREAKLNATGETVLRDRILNHLKQRLQIEDWYRRQPEIDDEQIIKPLIGLSLPRTGSTALSFLLAQDPNARSLLRSEAAAPCPPPSTRPVGQPPADATDKIKGWKHHTPTGENAPAECQDLMALEFRSQLFIAFAQIPSYAEWLNNTDMTSCYEYEKRALKLLQWRRPEQPWRLKAPTHLLYLEHLNRVFPDARFVMTHRDPTDVMLSVINVYTDIVHYFTDHMDPGYLAELNINMWSEGMRRALAFREQGNNHERFFDIHFQAMHDDPVAEVRRLYEWLGEPVTDEFSQGIRNWWQENTQNREAAGDRKSHDYGVDLDQVRPLFATYTQRMHHWTGRS